MTESIEKQLKRIIAKEVKLANGKTIRQNLELAVKYLYKCLDNQILAYYASYSPKVYERTFDFMDSLYAENFINARVNGNRIELSVSFKDSMSYHTNLFRDHKSYVPVLINFGWYAPKLEEMIGNKVYRLTWYEGFHMVEKAIKQFNSQNPYGVYISPKDVIALWNGNIVPDSRFKW